MATKPNIVFMLADNVGWGDLSCFGGLVPTPRLDRLASDPAATAEALLQEIASPALKDARVVFDGIRTAKVYPERLPNLPAGGRHDIHASGGGLLGSPAWMQIFADVLGEPVLALREAITNGKRYSSLENALHTRAASP